MLDPYRLHYAKDSLHLQVYNDDIDAVEQWLTDGGDPDVRAENGQTLLHAAVHGGHLAIVKILISHGADVNACSNETPYYTYPIQTASYNGKLDILDILVTHGADLTVETENGCTLVHLAVFNNEVEVMQYLLDREADFEIPADSGVTPLCSATMHSLKEATELLLRAGANPNAEYSGGLTSLAQTRDAAITKMLIEYGADVNHIGNNGRSPLFYVGSLEALEILLAYGARIDIIDADGNTLLHQTAAEMILIAYDDEMKRIVRALPEGMKIARLFVESGMDINIRNRKDQTPLTIALKVKNDEMATFLRLHGGIE